MFDAPVNSPERTKLDVSLVPGWAINDTWPKVAPMLKRATDMSEGRYDLEDLKYKLLTGEFHLWVVFDQSLNIIAAITSTFTIYPQAKSLAGQFLGGERLGDWQDTFLEVFEKWGKDNGCQFVELTGRAGWKRALEPNGFRETFRTYQKELTNG
jgi:hypothetical protein